MKILRAHAASLLLIVGCSQATAINVVIDYSYDTSGFFSTATADGQQARETIAAAADFLSGILEDSFPAIETPDPFVSTAFGQPDLTITWDWERQFFNPSTGQSIFVPGGAVAADEYIVYAGARDLSGNTLGRGGPGGWRIATDGFFYDTAGNRNTVNAISEDFEALVSRRSQAVNDFGGWGGSMTFDPGVNWNLDHEVAPTSNQRDLFSVALHELTHTVGFGITSESRITPWEAQFSPGGTTFAGTESSALWGGPVPMDAIGAHWLNSTQSTVFGTSIPQETLMDPDIIVGSRKEMTSLDAAGLVDIGWEITEPAAGLPGDYNGDLVVNAADYTIWRDALDGPNPIGSYAEWRENYGASAASSGQTVPEPVSLLTGLAAIGLWRRR